MEWKQHTRSRDEFGIVRNMEAALARVQKLMPEYKALEKRCRKRMERAKASDGGL